MNIEEQQKFIDMILLYQEVKELSGYENGIVDDFNCAIDEGVEEESFKEYSEEGFVDVNDMFCHFFGINSDELNDLAETNGYDGI
jgi:hypothetical protein